MASRSASRTVVRLRRPPVGSPAAAAEAESGAGAIGRLDRHSARLDNRHGWPPPPTGAVVVEAVVGAAASVAAAVQHGDGRVDGDPLRALVDQDLGERAFVDRLDLHGRLVGLDLGDHVARTDVVADLLQPTRELALGHRGRQRRHEDLGRHRISSPPARRSTTRPRPAPGSIARTRPRRRPSRLMSSSIGLDVRPQSTPSSSSRLRTQSLWQSRSVRILSTSSRVRYLAGSDMEWPR